MLNIKKTDLLHMIDGNMKVDVDKLNAFLLDVLTENGVRAYISNGAYKSEIQDEYQDFNVYNIFRIRYIEETSNFYIYFNRPSDISDVLLSNKEYSILMSRVVNVVAVLDDALELVWSENETKTYEECKWFALFYQFLNMHFEDVLISFEDRSFFIKECGMEIKVKPTKNKSGFEKISFYDKEIRICIDQFNEHIIALLEKELREKQVIEKLSAKTLTYTFATNESHRKEMRELLVTRLRDVFYFDSSEELLECVEKSISGPIFDVVFTTSSKVEVIKKDYFLFQLKYCKCDYGYYVFNWEEKKIILKRTKEELLQHCLKFINIDNAESTW